MIEEVNVSIQPLQNGLALGRSDVKITTSGRVPVQVANFSDSDIYINPQVPVGTIKIADMEPRVDLVQVNSREVHVCEVAPDDVQTDYVKQLLSRMSVNDTLDFQQQAKLEQVLSKHQRTFSKSDDDIGFVVRGTQDNYC